jgi:chitodextrinase
VATFIEYARKVRSILEKAVQSVTDDEALEAVTMFPKWTSGTAYTEGAKLQHNGVLYRVLQAHTSQDTWTPNTSPSLFAKVLIPDDDIIPEWEQPDSTNPYSKGDTVTHGGKTWTSDIDGNVWEPGVYGWSEVIT